MSTPVCQIRNIADAQVGWRVAFQEEARYYIVQARSERYLVCTKPFSLQRTVLYTVVDLQEQIRGTENLVFGAGAETREQCEQMIDRIEGRNNPAVQTEVSYRNRIPLVVARILPPKS